MADLEQLFQGETLKNSAGEERRIRVYPQDLSNTDETGDYIGFSVKDQPQISVGSTLSKKSQVKRPQKGSGIL